jgi:hypothetical protein
MQLYLHTLYEATFISFLSPYTLYTLYTPYTTWLFESDGRGRCVFGGSVGVRVNRISLFIFLLLTFLLLPILL